MSISIKIMSGDNVTAKEGVAFEAAGTVALSEAYYAANPTATENGLIIEVIASDSSVEFIPADGDQMVTNAEGFFYGSFIAKEEGRYAIRFQVKDLPEACATVTVVCAPKDAKAGQKKSGKKSNPPPANLEIPQVNGTRATEPPLIMPEVKEVVPSSQSVMPPPPAEMRALDPLGVTTGRQSVQTQKAVTVASSEVDEAAAVDFVQRLSELPPKRRTAVKAAMAGAFAERVSVVPQAPQTVPVEGNDPHLDFDAVSESAPKTVPASEPTVVKATDAAQDDLRLDLDFDLASDSGSEPVIISKEVSETGAVMADILGTTPPASKPFVIENEPSLADLQSRATVVNPETHNKEKVDDFLQMESLMATAGSRNSFFDRMSQPVVEEVSEEDVTLVAVPKKRTPYLLIAACAAAVVSAIVYGAISTAPAAPVATNLSGTAELLEDPSTVAQANVGGEPCTGPKVVKTENGYAFYDCR